MFHSLHSKICHELSSKLVSCSTGLRKMYLDYYTSILQRFDLGSVENATIFSHNGNYLGYITL